MNTSLLIDEFPLVLLPSLAAVIGLNEAIVIQQIHYWSRHATTVHDGHKWVYNTAEDWNKQFPFWSLNTVRNILNSLREKGLVIAQKLSDNKHDHTLYYRIDHDALGSVIQQNREKVLPNLGGSDTPNLGKTYNVTETTAETTGEKYPLTPKGGMALREVKKPQCAREMPSFDDDFNAIWALYPRKDVGKTVSRNSAGKLKCEEWDKAKETLPAWCEHWTSKTLKGEGQYIPHLSTFLNQRRFESAPSDPLPQKEGTGASLVNSGANRGIVETKAYRNPDGSVVIYRSDRVGSPPIVIPAEDADWYLERHGIKL